MSRFTDEALRIRAETFRVLDRKHRAILQECKDVSARRMEVEEALKFAEADLAEAILNGQKEGRILIGGDLIEAQEVMGKRTVAVRDYRPIP